MSFWISVSPREAEAFFSTVPPDPDDWDAWYEECNRLRLYSKPLGADGTVYEYWSGIAERIGLEMLASIYNNGLQVRHDGQIIQLESELDQLESYWNTYALEDRDPKSGIRHELREHLQERMGYMREAARVARECKGILTIS